MAVLTGIAITQENIKDFLGSVDISANSRDQYQLALRSFYDWLPEDKTVERGTLESWRDHLFTQNYAPRTVYWRISACNTFVEYMGRRDLQASPGKISETPQPELTREEYMRLLMAARAQGTEVDYLMIKLLASIDISLSDLSSITMEKFTELDAPEILRREVFDYTKRNGIHTGYLFRTRNGTLYRRTYIHQRINKLCDAARIPREKANPRCLQKLYRQTPNEIRGNIDRMVSITYNRMLEREQMIVAWRAG